jgi:hypothetical protein
VPGELERIPVGQPDATVRSIKSEVLRCSSFLLRSRRRRDEDRKNEQAEWKET